MSQFAFGLVCLLSVYRNEGQDSAQTSLNSLIFFTCQLRARAQSATCLCVGDDLDHFMRKVLTYKKSNDDNFAFTYMRRCTVW